MLKYFKLNRVIAAFSVMILLISIFSINIHTFANVINTITTANAVTGSNFDASAYADKGGNLLKDQPCTVTYYRNNTATTELDQSAESKKIAECFDSVTDTNLAAAIPGNASDDNSNTQTDNFIQFYFEINGELNNLEYFVFQGHMKKAGDKYMSQHYAVFASEKSNDLYTEKIKKS